MHVPIFIKSGNPNLLEPSGSVQVCIGIALPLLMCNVLLLFQHSSQFIGPFLISPAAEIIGKMKIGLHKSSYWAFRHYYMDSLCLPGYSVAFI